MRKVGMRTKHSWKSGLRQELLTIAGAGSGQGAVLGAESHQKSMRRPGSGPGLAFAWQCSLWQPLPLFGLTSVSLLVTWGLCAYIPPSRGSGSEMGTLRSMASLWSVSVYKQLLTVFGQRSRESRVLKHVCTCVLSTKPVSP